MKWIDVNTRVPDNGKCVFLKVHVTSVLNIVDREDILSAEYIDGKWCVDGRVLPENDYPIFNAPVAWAEN